MNRVTEKRISMRVSVSAKLRFAIMSHDSRLQGC